MRNLYICHTQYHVLITMLKSIKNREVENEIMLYSTIQDVERIKNELERKKLFKQVYIFDKSDDIMKSAAKKAKNQIDLKRKMKLILKEDDSSFECLQHKEIYVFNDDSIIGNYLRLNRKQYHLIEDGLNCYQNIEKHYCFENTLKEKVKNMLNTPDACFGKSRYVKRIEVNTKEDVSVYIRKKMCEVPRKQLFEGLTQKEKNDIISVFIEKEEWSNIKSATLIITQPLWQDGFLRTKEEQIKMYQSIINQYSKGQTIIKPHPRDEVDYAKEIQGSMVLKKEIPIEVFNFYGDMEIGRVITVFSTSLDMISFAKEKIKLGYEWMEKYKNGK